MRQHDVLSPVAGGPTVVSRIKEYILTNHLGPGDPLPTENELSQQLGVSRSRIREAVKTLSALDIVEVRHGYGTYVGQMSFRAMVESLAFRGMLNADDGLGVFAELVDFRELIETSLADKIMASLTPQAALSMRRLTEAMAGKASAGEEFAAEDREFHLLLMETAGTLAVGMTGAFWDVHALASRSLGPPDDLQATVAAHVAILDAIEKGDADVLRAAIRAHYAPIRERMTRRLPPRT
ncbi:MULTISPECIES: FadR/GntR family transcriptional regulator [Mycolicibacterium]|uniref:L-lactate dehydrogenase operon regulatory protein n=1 Tax=Mycolicibacterium mageritense TaxID=53462 RepID=A0AAI8TPI8_MYCME|nr:FadR/GntR family transcriptional regulator [Mycolicibacterium mageritense]BDY26479.1 Putative L-lactate dehydrogenase operon regulatory protein [Mycolicibacterium mageritense]